MKEDCVPEIYLQEYHQTDTPEKYNIISIWVLYKVQHISNNTFMKRNNYGRQDQVYKPQLKPLYKYYLLLVRGPGAMFVFSFSIFFFNGLMDNAIIGVVLIMDWWMDDAIIWCHNKQKSNGLDSCSKWIFHLEFPAIILRIKWTKYLQHKNDSSLFHKSNKSNLFF